MKKIIFILASILIILGILFFFPQKMSFTEKTAKDSNRISASPSAPITEQMKKAQDPLPPASQEEISRCLKAGAKDLNSFWLMVKDQSGRILNEHLEWRSIFFEDGEKRYRLSLSEQIKESGKSFYSLKLFELDKENLPDLAPLPEQISENPNDAMIHDFLKGKRISMVQEAKNLAVEGGSLHIETENDVPVEITMNVKGTRISCGSKGQNNCRCFSANSKGSQ